MENHLDDAGRWLGAVQPDSLDPILAGRYWWLRGGILYEMGQYEQSKDSIERALVILADNGDIDCHNWADFVSALLMPAFGEDPEEVGRRIELALGRFRGLGDRWGEGYSLVALGI